MEKIFLSDEDKALSLTELMKRFEIARSCAWRAKKRGYFCRGYHTRGWGEKPSRWLRPKPQRNPKGAGRKSHALPEGNLPAGVSEQEILRDARIAAFKALRATDRLVILLRGGLEDVVQESVLALLRETAQPEFVVRKWRIKAAYHAALDFLFRKNFVHINRELTSVSNAEGEFADALDVLPDPPRDQRFGDNRIFLAELRLILGEEKWTRLWAWAESSRNNPPGDVADIIRQIRREVGL